MDNFDEPVRLEITDELDLHHFSPKELKSLIPEYLEECLAAGIYNVRIIHGKGIGNIRRTVHSILSKLSIVKSFSMAPEDRGSWGATLVELKQPVDQRQE